MLKNQIKKVAGFTVVELLVTFSIMGILTAMSAPAIVRMDSLNRYESEVRSFVDMILEARANAISNKVCTTGASAEWKVRISRVDADGEDRYQLICVDEVGMVDERTPVEFQMSVFERLVFDETVAGGIDDLDPSTESEDVVFDYADISFVSGQLSSGLKKVTSVPPDTIESRKKVKVVLVHGGSGEIRTICFKRVAGFPTTSETEACYE